MQTIVGMADLRKARPALNEPVGLVPTMGYLHQGHLSLARRARLECSSVVATIFVNPTQFGADEDLSTYPHDLDRDLRLLAAEGVDIAWMPTSGEMYAPSFQTWVTVEEVTQRLEGEARPSHFRGVATVVAKLFNCVQPQRAYFGQKDAQQVVVIQAMTRDLNFPIEVVVCPTVREPDGLALSSRNAYLSPTEREAATVLYRALSAARDAHESGERDARRLRRIASETVESEPLARLQYVSCAHPDTLEELGTVTNRTLVSLAVFVGDTRLIDNLLLGDSTQKTGDA